MRFKKPIIFTSLLILVHVCFLTEAWARAGGGRNSGGGILAIILLPFFLVYGWYINKKLNKKKEAASALLQAVSKEDASWSEGQLVAHVRKTFFEIQNAWCNQDLEALRSLLHPMLFPEWKAQVEQIRSSGCRNVMEGLNIEDVRIVDIKNFRDDEKDEFTACIDASAEDYTVDGSGAIVDSNTRSGSKRKKNEKSDESFREFWIYEREGKDWLLRAVKPSDYWKTAVRSPMVDEK